MPRKKEDPAQKLGAHVPVRLNQVQYEELEELETHYTEQLGLRGKAAVLRLALARLYEETFTDA